MLLAKTLVTFGLLTIINVLEAGLVKQGCRDKCSLAAGIEGLSYFSELVAQAEAYAFQWKSDCGCIERRKTYLAAAIAYLQGAVVASGGEPVRNPSKGDCPEWSSIEADFKEINKSIEGAIKILHQYLACCDPREAVCNRWNLSLSKLQSTLGKTIVGLIEALLSEDCQSAPCDSRLACRCPPDGQCKLSCNQFDLAQYWLQVAKAENIKAREIFARAQPTDCDECCLLQRTTMFGALGHYFVSVSLSESIFGSSKGPKAAIAIAADPSKSSCSRLNEWLSIAGVLDSTTMIFDNLQALLCAGSYCPSNGFAEEAASQLVNYLGGVVEGVAEYVRPFCGGLKEN